MMNAKSSFLIVLVIFLSACAAATPAPTPLPTPNAQATETQLAAKIFATQTASVPTVTNVPPKTPTPSEPPIRWDEARKYAGFTKTVCGLIASSRFDSTGDWLYFGYYVGQSGAELILNGLGVALILDKEFIVDQNYYVGKAICATGRIQATSLITFIQLKSRDQIQEK